MQSLLVLVAMILVYFLAKRVVDSVTAVRLARYGPAEVDEPVDDPPTATEYTAFDSSIPPPRDGP